ncbi:ribosyldihydronicotinamide dehydrogenase [quinone]-like, partial [Pundamilia nyererei]|uniref:Ribosyldihydronicotinamide dehydrogenase [quinone]-like n=1 Tax=Pundamilia nyererei TaxID=303518 RepID=A0A9Y6JF50_9CICH
MFKKVLIVYAHESPASFNAAAKDAAVAALTAQGCTVEVSDLYAMKFKAAATTEDITGGLKDAENFCYAKEIKLASEEGRLAEDLKKEQEKLKEADLVIFQFPMYWSSVPAIMKGWMDRVLGFAYAQEKWYSEGIFKDKKAMLSFTTDCPESVYSDTGINGDINVILCDVEDIMPHPYSKDATSQWPPGLQALTSDIMKTLERLILDQLRPIVRPHLDPLQFAYQLRLGTEDAIIYLLNRVYTHLDQH